MLGSVVTPASRVPRSVTWCLERGAFWGTFSRARTNGLPIAQAACAGGVQKWKPGGTRAISSHMKTGRTPGAGYIQLPTEPTRPSSASRPMTQPSRVLKPSTRRKKQRRSSSRNRSTGRASHISFCLALRLTSLPDDLVLALSTNLPLPLFCCLKFFLHCLLMLAELLADSFRVSRCISFEESEADALTDTFEGCFNQLLLLSGLQFGVAWG